MLSFGLYDQFSNVYWPATVNTKQHIESVWLMLSLSYCNQITLPQSNHI
jgi:hypothetical protein